MISKVWLPDGQHYQLLYNTYGELSRAILPAGGAVEYDWQEGVSGTLPNAYGVIFTTWNREVLRRIKERRTYPNGGTGTGWDQRQEISRPESQNGSTFNSVGYVDVKTWGQGGLLLSREKHYYLGVAAKSFNAPGHVFATWDEGREWKTEYLNDNGEPGVVIRKIETDWVTRTPVTYNASGWQTSPSNEPRIAEIRTTLDDGKVSKVTHRDPITGHVWIDEYNNIQKTWEYDFGIGAPGPLIRSTHTTYLTTNGNQGGVNYATEANIHIRHLPIQKIVHDAAGIVRSQTDFIYDYYGAFSLVACPGIVQHDGAFHTGYGARGNLTGMILRNPGGSPSEVHLHNQYDIAGNMVKVVDGRGIPTDYDYSDRFGFPDDEAQSNAGAPELAGGSSYAFPTRVTNALNHTAYTQYDYYLGKPVNSEDANGIVSSIAYNDALDRPTQEIQARYKVGSGVPAERRQTTIIYDDVNRVITTTSDRDAFNDNILSSKSYSDGLGRPWRGAASEGSTWMINDTQFDALGRVSQVSNPYRAADPGSASPPAGLWTTTEYDALGRVIRVTTPDGAHVDTAYSGNNTLVIDQAGKKRISRTDAPGRLTNVWEVRSPDAASGTVSISFPNHPEVTAGYQTDYFYDPLDNMRAVSQGAQGRWFSYDSLSRLIRVRTLEQNCNGNLPPHTDPFTGGYCWSTAYSYDANGNLTQRIDVRGIVTNYFYDALNRNWGIDYINGSQKSNVARVFDGAVNGKGRLYWDRTQEGDTQELGTNVTNNSIDSYDALGRPLQKRQHFWHGGNWGPGYYMQHTYDLAGNVKTLTYPSGRTVNYSYDQAGRLSSFSGNLGGSPYTYADTIGYNAAEQMIKERFGTNTSLYHNLHYNNRMQLVDTRLGDSATDEWSWSRGAIAFFYGTTAANTWNQFANDTDNNGNLRRQMNFVPLAGGGDIIPQVGDYTYDALNRVATFRELQRNASLQWTESASQDFSYDRYGNRKITAASSGVSNYNPSYDQATNRINGLSYDAAGNITSDPLTGGTMTYDPENRLLTATSGGGGSYVYNADGRRVKRGAGGQETWQIYGCDGELLAEYAAGAQPTAPQKEYGYRNGQLLVIAEPGSGGNLAWGKATSQSSTGFGGNSSRGVDGNTNGSWSGNSVTHTQLEHQPWWLVDLGSVQQIGTLKLWNRTDCCSERLSNFYVLVSDNPFNSTDLTTTINQAGVSNYHTAGQAGVLTEIGVGRSGRYVRVQLAGDNYLSLAEVEVMAGTASGEGVKWLVQDHLGSTRMVVDRTGSLAGIKRHDFAPFGEELFAGVGIRSASNGYSGDLVRQKFTGYERDGETGLDFAQARYYSSTQGRFTSTDPRVMEKSRLADPQGINLYAYTRNNPLKYVDPDGERFKGKDGTEVRVDQQTDKVTGKKIWVIKNPDNATEDLKKLVGLVNNSGSKEASDLFRKLNKIATMINIVIDSTTSDGNLTIGLHEPHGKNGKLTFDSKTDKFSGIAEQAVDKKGNPIKWAYKEATITLFKKRMEDLGSKGQALDDELVATFGHEVRHDTDEIQIQAGLSGGGSNAIWHPTENGKPKKNSPEWSEQKIKDEIKASRSKKP